jgi:hypothetical protein
MKARWAGGWFSPAAAFFPPKAIETRLLEHLGRGMPFRCVFSPAPETPAWAGGNPD